jgi:hypothetical protein
LSLLGLAGSATATYLAGWISPALIGLSLALLGRSFYTLYVQKRGQGVATVLTWTSAIFVVGFWTWRILFSS